MGRDKRQGWKTGVTLIFSAAQSHSKSLPIRVYP